MNGKDDKQLKRSALPALIALLLLPALIYMLSKEKRTPRSQSVSLSYTPPTTRNVSTKQKNNKLSEWKKRCLWLPYIISVILFLLFLYFIAFSHPLNSVYTETTAWSYVLLSSPAIAGLFVTLHESKNNIVRLVIIIAIDLYLLGLTLQLFGFFSIANLIGDLQ